jgi:hypothetical protein
MALVLGAGWPPRTTVAFVKLLAAPNLACVTALERVPIDAIPNLPPLPLTRLGTYTFARAKLSMLLDGLPRFPRLESLALVVDDGEPLDDVIEGVLAAAPDLPEIELSAEITRLGAGCLRRVLSTRLPRLRLSGATPLVLDRSANGAGFFARARLAMGFWMGESIAEQVVLWVESDPEAPILRFELEPIRFFDDDQRARLRAVLGDRLLLSPNTS